MLPNSAQLIDTNSPHTFTYNLTFLNHFNILFHWIMHSVLVLSVYLYRYFDKGILEILGPLGINRLLQFTGFQIERTSTGHIPHYSLILISFMLLPIILLLLSYPLDGSYKLSLSFFSNFPRVKILIKLKGYFNDFFKYFFRILKIYLIFYYTVISHILK